ncbi:N-formylglutamate amidohydrolase [Oligoflexaceae bacterium]|nr:N-formylglutamate amidohydrolase [Oligoflexaceae bacterium]
MNNYFFKRPETIKFPILISSPHSGIDFPKDEASLYLESVANSPMDTDWFIGEIYDFADELGIPLISAKYSRYVVDLNRPIENKPLYADGRRESGVFPTLSFAGQPLYKSETPSTDHELIFKQRIQKYYQPYRQKITETLSELTAKFGGCLLFDAHSIKSTVTSIQQERFPSFIVGTASGSSCPDETARLALDSLEASKLGPVSFNSPFKGGHITRSYGDKNTNTWSLQLEMTQDLYLDEATNLALDSKMNLLKTCLRSLILTLGENVAQNFKS